MNKIIEVREIVKKVLDKRNYFILFVCVSLVSFLILYLLSVATITNQSLRIFIMMNGFWYSFSMFFMLVVIALLFGVYISLFVFKIKLNCQGKGILTIIFGTSGLLVGLFGAGCPMCGAVLFALLGMPLALFFLPFKGLELRVIAIILLALSVYFLSINLTKCKIKLN